MSQEPTHFHNDDLRFDLRIDGPEDGEPVVLLHGFPQDSTSYDRLVPVLTGAGYRTYRYDQRGYSPGARPRGVRNYRLRLLLEDLHALARTFDLVPFHLVGHDWGGVLGWHMAGHDPDALRSFTSLSMPHPSAYVRSLLRPSQGVSSLYAGFFQIPRLAEWTLARSGSQALRRGLIASGLPGEDADRYVRRFETASDLTPPLSWYRAATRSPRRLGAPRSKVPTLYIWGTEDTALARVSAEATAAYGGDRYRFRVLDGANHWLPETCSDEIAPLIVEHFVVSGPDRAVPDDG